MNKNQRLRACFLTLDAYGCTINETLEALKSLKHCIVLPFNPQASDNILEAQVPLTVPGDGSTISRTAQHPSQLWTPPVGHRWQT